MRNTTLLFLVRRSGGEISEVCLAMKKRGFGAGRWNGVGGKVAEGESIEEATLREAKEEIGVEAGDLNKVAELTFTFPHNPNFDQLVHTYFSESWQGEPTESEEMSPKWFAPAEIPFKEMWPDDQYWLPKAISGKLIKASFTFGEKDVILDQQVEEVTSLNA